MENMTLLDIAAAVRAGGVGVAVVGAAGDVVVTGTSCDSRTTQPGDLFVCKGAAFRPAFLTGALERGAVAYLCDEARAAELAAVAPGTPALVVDELRRAMALASAAAFRHPDRSLPIIGITGTKGKTTAAYMLRSIVEAAHGEGSCGVMGTVETYDGSGRAASNNTTPEPPDLWRHLANARDAHLAAMVMEVSSQALKYDRTLDVNLTAGCFLNIGLDHISPVEHADFEDYFSSKLKIFSQADTAVVNLDSDHANRIVAAAGALARTLTFGVNRPEADVFADELSPSEEGIAFTLHLGAEHRRVQLPFPGEFSVSDALCAAACAQLMNIDANRIAEGLAATHVPGRMEFYRSADRRLTVVVDYAHNGFAFESLLSTVAGTFGDAQTIAVFGAVGGKARERRYELPEVAARYVSRIILTSDDPWTEDPADICREMEGALPEGFPHEVVLDREAAAERAFELAEATPGRSVVLLLAKGHEAYQLTKDGFVPCVSDRELARRGIAAHDRAHSTDSPR